MDEAQDFAENWLDALGCLLCSRDDSVYAIYGDGHQTLWQRGWQQWMVRRMRKSFPFALPTPCCISSRVH